MFSDVLDIEEIRTADSVSAVNELLQEGWELIGFHPAPPSGATHGAATTIFVMARLSEYDDDSEGVDVDLEDFEPISS